jgi:hypothetical protein
MGAKRKSKENSKADFVRQQPRDMPVKEVIAKGKEADLTLTENYVAQVRSNMGKETAATRAAGRASSKKAGPAKVSRAPADSAAKAAFVAKFPATKPATDIVKEARKAGLTMSEKFVYKLRAKGKVARRGQGPARKPTTRTNGIARGPAPTMDAKPTSAHEAHFAAAIVDLGFEQAQATLARVRDRILRAATS